MRHSAESNLKIEYLCEYEFIFKTALAHESGDLGVLFAEKNRGSKLSWDCPFKHVHSHSLQMCIHNIQERDDLNIDLQIILRLVD
jgi:hypothetical protein